VAVVLYFSMSLDGFVAGPNIDRENPMGVGGESLHDWMFGRKQPADQPFIDEQHGDWGAVVIGRRTFDLGYEHWGDTPYPAPSFVVTHRPREPEKAKSATFTFVTDGIESALAQAKAVAGGKDVVVMGGETARQLLALGLVDRIELQLTPILLHDGAKLFDGLERANLLFTPRGAPVTTSTTHLSYNVRRA
jgi:dihydrofolate reductase